jgi:hypothetical protein
MNMEITAARRTTRVTAALVLAVCSTALAISDTEAAGGNKKYCNCHRVEKRAQQRYQDP